MNLRDQFLLDPDIAFLNHGFAGACPRVVFEAMQARQRECEAEPVDFLSCEGTTRLAEVRAVLGGAFDADADDLVLMTNGTTALNAVARSLALGPGDELLTTDHEHGGILRAFRYAAERRGFAVVQRAVPLPVTTHADFADWVMAGVTPNTRAILLSHMTATSALVLPVAQICRRARDMGLVTVIDGAHGPGQLPLSLREIGADFYVGILHKWLCAPRSSAFLYVRRAMQERFEPPVVSWGWRPETPGVSRFIDANEWQGSRDLAPFLTVPDAIAFQRACNRDAVRARCVALAAEAQAELARRFTFAAFHENLPEWRGQMAAVRLPAGLDTARLQRRLRFEHGVDVSVERFAGEARLRVSVQGYNDARDVERLLAALTVAL